MTLQFHQIQYSKIIDEILTNKLGLFSITAKDMENLVKGKEKISHPIIADIIQKNTLSKEEIQQLINRKMIETVQNTSIVPRPLKSDEGKYLSLDSTGSILWSPN